MISEAALHDLKNRNPVHEVAGRWVSLRRHGKGFIGPCPFHSKNPQARDSTSFECDVESWVCAVCCDGGDVIRLVKLYKRCDFLGAIEWLGGTQEPDFKEVQRLAAEREKRRSEQKKTSALYRERERRIAFDIWRHARPIHNTPAWDYLALRGLEAPPGAKLRYADDLPAYDGGGKNAKVLHRGPAMLAAIMGPDRRFAGVHRTWIDLERPKGKALIIDPDTGEPENAKKVRGSQKGNFIELVPQPLPQQLIIGEGIETVLAVWVALRQAGRDLSQTAFWSSINLGNLGGAALSSVPHPTRRLANNRRATVPSPEPDLEAPGIAVPDSISDIVLLGDGDSDRFITECALVRAAARFAQPGRTVRAAWAPAGKDFNDLLCADGVAA